jgi:hypothetical protein
LAQERGHVRKVGKLVSVSSLWDQGKLDEHVAVLDMAENRASICSPTDAAKHLVGLLFGPRLQHLVDLLECRLLALQLVILALQRLGVCLGLVRVKFADGVAVTADGADGSFAVAL